MSLLLGMIVKNEEPMLKLTLPMSRTLPYLKVALDFDSTDDSVAILRQHGWVVIESGAWGNDYGAARNRLLAYGKAMSASNAWMLQLDADECIEPANIERLVPVIGSIAQDVISFPRHNYVRRGTIREVGSYPDKQARCIRLASPLRYTHIVHEVIDLPPLAIAYQPDIHIHHYGFCKPFVQTWLRLHNYDLIKEGKPLSGLAAVPMSIRNMTEEKFLEDLAKTYRLEAYDGDHPLKGKL